MLSEECGPGDEKKITPILGLPPRSVNHIRDVCHFAHITQLPASVLQSCRLPALTLLPPQRENHVNGSRALLAADRARRGSTGSTACDRGRPGRDRDT